MYIYSIIISNNLKAKAMKTTTKKAKVLLLLIVSVIQVSLSGQNKIDSLLKLINNGVEDTMKVKRLNQLGLNLFMEGRVKESEQYLNQSLNISSKIDYKRGGAISNALLGSVMMAENNNPMALRYNFKSLEIYKSINDTTCLNYISKLNDIATIYMKVGLYSNSLQYYLRALKVAEQINDKHLIILFNGNIGCLYKDKGDYDKSIDFYNKVLSFSKQNNDTLSLYPNALMGLGDLYYSKNNLKKSLNYYSRFLNVSKFIDDSSYICSANIGIANVLKSYADYDNAISHLNVSLSFNDAERNSKSHLCLGEIYMAQKNYTSAYNEFEKSLILSKSIDYKDNICVVYKNLSNLDSLTGNYLGSMNKYKLYVAYSDSVNNTENEKKMLASEMNYKFDKEKSSMQLESELKSNKQKSIITLIALILTFVVFLAIFIYKSYLGKNKANKLISYQKHLVEEKQKEILDNINYAKRIQSSIMPTDEYITNYAKQNFVMYNPKDIVSGDFYWATELDGKFYLATADCTGHGVSGSMMSMLNISALNEVVNHRNINNTGEILDEVRKEIIHALNPKGNEGVNDGMDCVLCRFDLNGRELQYSAANNSFYIIRNNEIIVCKADKMPVGLGIKTDSFATKTINLCENDMVYMFTDGYADQFGGEKGKKFKYKQLEELLLSISQLSMTEQRNALNEAFNSWKGDTEQTDDVLIIGVKIN
jgi:serine phosphatase RsbU (regulator of sigma subunit)